MIHALWSPIILSRSDMLITCAGLVRKKGFSRRKTGQISTKADPVPQQRFLDTALTPVLEEAKAGRRHVFFVDAHFVLGAWPGLCVVSDPCPVADALRASTI